jgi:DNA-binding CsgD family transcriptional regulator
MNDELELVSRSSERSERLTGRGSPAVPAPRRVRARAAADPHASEVVRIAAEAVLDKLERRVVIIDGEARLLFANASARALLDIGTPIMRVGDARVALATLDAQQRLNAYLAGTRSQFAPAMTVRVGGNGCRRPCRIVVTPLSSPTLDKCHADRGSLYAMFVHELDGQRTVSAQILREVYGLTAAEAQTAMLLFEGRSVREAADWACISVSTVRTHLKHIFVKCGVGSQIQLMRLLALGPRTF